METLQARKASGYDSIPPFVLRVGTAEIATSLTNLLNRGIYEEHWLHSWKKREWVLVFKRDDPLLKENYKPITVLPVVDKVFKQIVAKQLVGIFDHHLEQTLTAYRKTHSCETTLINLTELWRLARDNKQTVGMLTTEMSKAFDSMHPALLLSKLRAYGFQESLIRLLCSYLCDHYNRVSWLLKKVPREELTVAVPEVQHWDHYCGTSSKMT